MSKIKNILVILIVIAITGWIRLPIEQKLADDLHKHKLVPPRLSLKERARLKQKAFVATYGSLRPTIAAFMSSSVAHLHSNQEWDEIEDRFEEINLLDPYNFYYWDTASWHMAVNAAGDLKKDKSLTEFGQEKIFRKYIQKGKDIINKGYEINPKNWKFLESKAALFSDKYRNPDYATAIEANKELLKYPKLPAFNKRKAYINLLYQTQQFPEKHQEAYGLAIKLFRLGKQYRTPIVVNQIFKSQNHPLTKIQTTLSLIEIYGSKQEALRDLRGFWNALNEKEKHGYVKDTIKLLENELKIPSRKRTFPHKPIFIK